MLLNILVENLLVYAGLSDINEAENDYLTMKG
jgi:hypothetical protein